MFPILYEGITAGVVPEHNGLGVLSDCISCEVEQERNGIYELVMEYPKSGIHAQDIGMRRILKVKPNFTDNPQLFRIDRIGKEINGKFTVYAKHISYDLSGYIIERGSASSAIAACNLLEDAADGYTFDTDKVVSADFVINPPASVKSYFNGRQGSFLDVYGTAEIKYDNFHINFLTHAGQDRGVTIRYGKNLLELSQEMNSSNLYTHVFAYYNDQDGTIIDGNRIPTGLVLDVPKIYILDCTSSFEETPTVQDLDALARKYIEEHNITVPSNNIKLDFVQSGELKDRIDLCDTVSIYYEALGITRTQVKCIRTKWDCLKEKYIETEFGDIKADITTTIIANSSEIASTKQDIVETNQTTVNYINAIKASLDDDIEDLQEQIDGNITTWYYNYAPTTSNEPAVEWVTEEDKEKHAGDLFYDNTTQFCYRWTYSNNAWGWVLIQDTTISQAIGLAQQALDEAEAAISGVDVEYAQNQSTSVAPVSGWSTTPPSWQEGYYIWSRTKTTTSSGTTYSAPVCISGRDGQDGAKGDTGIGVSNVVEQYYLSTSSSSPTGGSWTNTQPAWERGKYIWTRSVITWTDTTTSTTTPVLAQAINSANNLADNKRRVFVVQPVPPYDIGDLWTNGSDIYYCSTAKSSGAFVQSDWTKASNYVNPTAMQTAINTATAAITGNSGGYVVFHDANNDGKPDEILIMDTASISTATKVWRWNNSGLGYSSTGYSGTYGTAINQNGQIVADFITAGTLNANLIKAGVISDILGKSTIDLATGIAKLYELNAIKGFNLLTEGDEDVKGTMSATQFGADLILSATNASNPQAKITTYSRQSDTYARLELKPDGQTLGVVLYAQASGGSIYAHNQSGTSVAELFARNDQRGGTVRVKDANGNIAGYLSVDANGCGEFALLEPSGETRLHIFDNGYSGCLDLCSNAGTAVSLWTDSTLCGHVHVENNAYEHTVELDGSKGEVQCLRIKPYDPAYSVDNASGTMKMDGTNWEVRRMGNVVYMSIPFKGKGVNVPAGSTAFTGTLTDGDLPAIACNMVAYYSGDVFILNIKPTGEMTLRNCGAARTFSSNQGITVCGSFIVD